MSTRRSDAKLYSAGVDAAEHLLSDVYGFGDVIKADKRDPLDPGDFETISERLGGALHGVSGSIEKEVYNNALKHLDVDWTNLSSEEQSKVFKKLRTSLKEVEDRALPQMDKILKSEAKSLVTDSRRSVVKTYGLKIPIKPSEIDKKIQTFLHESQRGFLSNEFKSRRSQDVAGLHWTVAAGLKDELDNHDIITNLHNSLLDNLEKRNLAYSRKMSMNFTNTARTYSLVSAYDEAGIDEFEFKAVIDSVTSKMCHFMNGHVFSVPNAAKRVRSSLRLRDPDLIRNAHPFMNVTGKDEDGKEHIFYEKDNKAHVVTPIIYRPVQDVRPAAEQEETPWKPAAAEEQIDDHTMLLPSYPYSNAAGRLDEAGVTLPPLHFHCRSTIIPKMPKK